MEELFQVVTNFIAVWGYAAIAAGMALESACIPIPSELIFGFAGYLVYLGHLSLTPAVMAGTIGGLAGSVAAYLIGYYGGRPLVARYGRYVFLSKQHVDTAQRWFDRYGLTAVLFSRLLPVVRTFISLPAGFARVNFGLFVLYTAIGSIPWTIGLIYAGMVLGENWQALNSMGHKSGLVVVAVLIAFAVYYYQKSHLPAGKGKGIACGSSRKG